MPFRILIILQYAAQSVESVYVCTRCCVVFADRMPVRGRSCGCFRAGLKISS